MFTAVFSLLGSLVKPIGEYFKNKSEIRKINAQTEQQIALERQKLAAQIAKADAERATVALGATSAKFKYVVFGLISSPFVATLIGFPEYATSVFDNLRALPEWYMIMYTSIIAVIWGIPVQGSIMNNIFDSMRKSRELRREYKLAKINRKDFYDGLRAAQGFVTEKDVKKFNKVLQGMTE